jgi:hypothetical protein
VLIKKIKMKTVLTKFLVLGSMALLVLASCKKNDPTITSNGGKPGTLTASTTSPVLDKTKLSDTTKIINFSFTKANYGFSAAVTSTLQIDAASDNWAKPMSVTLSNGATSQGYSTADFNALLLKLNLTAGIATPIQVRLMQSVGTSVAPIYSNTLALTVTPFNLTSWLYVVGAFDGWPPLPAKGTDSLISVTGNGIYVGIINFTAGNNQFLILPQSNNYNNKYATNDPQGSTSSTVTQNAPNNLYAPSTAGQYMVTFNSNNGTISFAPVNYYSVIGNAAKGWDAGDDVDMKFVNDGNQTWVVTLPMTQQAAPNNGFKIRKNHDWGTAYGTPATPDGKTLTSASGVNIGVAAAGTYTITFWLNPADNTGTTAFYTQVKQ